mmetsp:Transcript_41254/g.100100  ORF Transcript_41254/g.100100 Transcript_41254/m.100100 type:complete len:151 (+) Transcript_41254:253-705(+)
MAHENAALHVVPWCEARRPACLHDGPCCNELLLASPIVEVLSLQASSADTWTILNCSAFSAACDLRGGTLDRATTWSHPINSCPSHSPRCKCMHTSMHAPSTPVDAPTVEFSHVFPNPHGRGLLGEGEGRGSLSTSKATAYWMSELGSLD